MTHILKLKNINTGYNKKQILFNIDLEIERGKTTLLIGSNGSGKSTLFKTIYKQLPLWSEESSIVFDNEDISQSSTHHLISKGIVYVPQKNALFEDFTVRENLEYCVLHLKNKELTKKRLSQVVTQFELLRLKINSKVHALSGGERKILSIGMAMMNHPKLLLLDEPLAGISTGKNVKIVLQILKNIQILGTTIVIIEHRIKETLPICDVVRGLKLGHLHKDAFTNLNDIKSFFL